MDEAALLAVRDYDEGEGAPARDAAPSEAGKGRRGSPWSVGKAQPCLRPGVAPKGRVCTSHLQNRR